MPMHFDCWETEPQTMTLDQYRAGIQRDADALLADTPIKATTRARRAKPDRRAR